jgi:hypothetical protein
MSKKLGDVPIASEGNAEPRLITYSDYEKVIEVLMGEVLTIIDASSSGQQNKAIKDLIKQKFNFHRWEVWDWGFLWDGTKLYTTQSLPSGQKDIVILNKEGKMELLK